MLDRESFRLDMEELEKQNDPCVIEYYLNKWYMDLKDNKTDCDDCCCGYGQFTGGTATKEYEELLQRDKEQHRLSDIVFVLGELEKFYSTHKPELVNAVAAEKKKYIL